MVEVVSMNVYNIVKVRSPCVANEINEGIGIVTKIEVCDVYKNINRVWVLLTTGQYDWFYDVDVERISMDLIWNHVFRALNEMYWDNKLRHIPIFEDDLEGKMLGDFRHTPEGINSILLSKNQKLTDLERIGVLLHEMCHQAVFQAHGCEVYPHGDEWKKEMKNCGFAGKINRWTDGTNRFDKNDLEVILGIYERKKKEFEEEAKTW